ncbi:hypothetical protein M422DRAFT_259492 [Sphaerobolus stellatus SS14]|uniref:Uncharacterized protein n=1 Tax=Sphaerobolus stellatus (strain SS14) TaxID=990650 RepID=A0A0C9UST3_SPHS4|nr:hypothetical protein M422DRAFT_259492 [Sphaerobolus stellatus SS14]
MAMEAVDGESESCCTISWIWMVPGSQERDTDDQSSNTTEEVRIEWCRARAHAQHWDEQRMKVKWWTTNAEEGLTEVGFASLKAQRGVRAYACSQVEVMQHLGQEFSVEWDGAFTELEVELGLGTMNNGADEGEEGPVVENESDEEGMDDEYVFDLK